MHVLLCHRRDYRQSFCSQVTSPASLSNVAGDEIAGIATRCFSVQNYSPVELLCKKKGISLNCKEQKVRILN
jgi:hypothetical protein